MAEPTTTGSISLTVIFVALLGPLAGPYALIAFAALAGALWPLSAQTTVTRTEGAWLLLRCTLTAIVLTGVAASVLERQWQIPVNEALLIAGCATPSTISTGASMAASLVAPSRRLLDRFCSPTGGPTT